jgi:hypothetical protein
MLCQDMVCLHMHLCAVVRTASSGLSVLHWLPIALAYVTAATFLM